MSGIFGRLNRDGGPVDADALDAAVREMAAWGREGGGVLREGPCALGVALSRGTPEACYERLPSVDAESGIAFAAAGRVDNRAELLRDLAAGEDASRIADGELMRRAHRRWGDDCAPRIFGDWSFAAWDSRARRLLLARDHSGKTALYYCSSGRVFAFASSRRALLAMNLTAVEMDELYLAQLLISWPAYHGERTIHKALKRLPPAHTVSVKEGCEEVRRYWTLEDVPEVRRSRRGDYADGLRDVFDRAVEDRLRSTGSVGVTLSGGLDSGSVAITAAGLLRTRGLGLTAFTSVPRFSCDRFVGARFGDESVYAALVARAAANIETETVDAAGLSPLEAIRQALEITTEPMHSASNLFWLLEMNRRAAERGCRVLLTGQQGNGGISWNGALFSQPLAVQLRQLGWRAWLHESLRRRTPHGVLRALRKKRFAGVWRDSAIHPKFAERLDLLSRRLDDPEWYPVRRARFERCEVLRPGRSFVGALHAELGAAAGIEVRDPTADARVQAYCFSVPETIFIDRATGMDRWLIREAMKGRLPDEVRLNRRRGRQAGDLVPRLRASAPEVEGALATVERGPAAEYVDVGWMRKAWRTIQVDDSMRSLRMADRILTRGIMAALFIERMR